MAAGLITGGSHEGLGLFWNPFGAVESERWPELIVTQGDVDLDDLAERLREPGFALVLRGEAGRGKSTHLRALHARFARLPFTYLGPDASPRTPIPRAAVVFVDEAQRLGPRARRSLLSGSAWERLGPCLSPRPRWSLALTSHEDLSPELEAAGYAVQERTIAGLDDGRLAAIVARRVAWAARPEAGSSSTGLASLAAGLAPRPWLERLVAEHGDDLRTIQDHLYDRVEGLRRSDPSHVPSQL